MAAAQSQVLLRLFKFFCSYEGRFETELASAIILRERGFFD